MYLPYFNKLLKIDFIADESAYCDHFGTIQNDNINQMIISGLFYCLFYILPYSTFWPSLLLCSSIFWPSMFVSGFSNILEIDQ